ncbi:electron transfer flavoprotein subunit alpha/FixB family protein [Bacillaceae bacterium IKA-2]|jgi:electron transfer flavoprotein alpha subunit|nr:electron transfer flavoprotein subunit alpha/FixB family protein [Bacillaceae bacterium IKA-2]
MARKILVLADVRDNSFRNVSFEAIAAGKKVADGGEVVVAILGDNVSGLAGELFNYGADRVLTVEDDNLKTYTPDAYSQALLQVIEEEAPDALLMGHTAMGKDLAPRIAMKKQAGLVSDAIDLEVNGEEVIFTRPIYAGKAFEKIVVSDGMILATIRPNNIAPLEKDESLTGEAKAVSVEIKDLRTIIKDIVRKSTGGVDLSEAKIVVAGGRGVKSEEGFKKLYELADTLGAAVGASRGACDAEYCDYSLQIGQTGKVVTPDLYIALGVSGAIQHVAGMSNSKCIVAVNKDPEATIFTIADYGIVGDLAEILPLLVEEFKKEVVRS